MLRLTTFGGVALLQDGTPHIGPASQRRRLALLVLIAAAGKRGISRDKLFGLLWPDSSPDSARHALHQSLHMIRRSLGADALFDGTATLRLNAELVSSDVAEFDEAIARGAHEQAVRLYAGPFLDGFRLDGADEFERWQDLERVRRAREYAGALEALAAAAAARLDHAAAVRWWRRLASAEPLSTRAALGLVEALVAAGDPAGALQFATVHAALVREHLEAPPDKAIEGWIARLRAGDVAAPGTASDALHTRRATPIGSDGGIAAAADQLEELRRALHDRYVVDTLIAEGALLLTFVARDRRDTRPVELHVFQPRVAALANSAQVLHALERVSALHDPRIVPVLDWGAAGGLLYFATAPVDGESLRERLARERQLPIEEAVRIASDIAGALAYAHGHGSCHGDLRPRYVMLTPAGVSVASFGLVEALRVATGDRADATVVSIGAPAYQSPEQLAGETAADERSDVYSLGCIVFEMLAGEPPFGSVSSLPTFLRRKFTEPAPAVRLLRESVPEALDRIVSKCLARVAADRYRTATEAREALIALRVPTET